MAVNLSDFQEIEYRRRCDVAFSLIDAAVYFDGIKTKASEVIGFRYSLMLSKWLWASIVLGLIIHFLLVNNLSFEWNIGSYLSAFALGLVVLAQLEITIYTKRFNAAHEKLLFLYASWDSAVGVNTLKNVKDYTEDGFLDKESSKFEKWISRQHTIILQRVVPSNINDRLASID